jgi:transposase InsO family protein
MAVVSRRGGRGGVPIVIYRLKPCRFFNSGWHWSCYETAAGIANGNTGISAPVNTIRILSVLARINNSGKKPRILYTDNSGQFVSKTFEEVLKVQCIFHHRIDKGKPWQNGKIERLFKTLFDEWIAYNRYVNEASLKESITKFREWFNNEREIQNLDYKTPMQLLKEKSSV